MAFLRFEKKVLHIRQRCCFVANDNTGLKPWNLRQCSCFWCYFLLASQHPLGLWIGTFSCVYDFKWVIMYFNVNRHYFFTAVMFLNVCRSTSTPAHISSLQHCHAMFSNASWFQHNRGQNHQSVITKHSSVSERRMVDATAASALLGMDSRSPHPHQM